MNRFFFGFSVALMFAAPAWAHTEPKHFRGALLEDAVFYAQDNGPGGPGDRPVEQMTREELQAEYQRLDQERPSIGGPIALTAVGGGLLIIGLGVLLEDFGLY